MSPMSSSTPALRFAPAHPTTALSVAHGGSSNSHPPPPPQSPTKQHLPPHHSHSAALPHHRHHGNFTHRPRPPSSSSSSSACSVDLLTQRKLLSPPPLTSARQPPSYSSAANALPMAIPRAREPVPPPLPPPTHLPEISAGHDLAWRWGNDPHSPGFGRPAFVKPGSSLLGSASLEKESASAAAATSSYNNLHDHFYSDASHHYTSSAPTEPTYPADGDAARRGSSISTVTMPRDNAGSDSTVTTPGEDGSSSRRPSDYRLHGERQLGQKHLAQSSQSYDKHLLSRIGGPNTPKRQSISYASGAQDNPQLANAESERRNSNAQLKPLSMPSDKSAIVTDSPATSRWPNASSAVSPGTLPFWSEHADSSARGQPTRHSSLQFEDSISQRGSYDQAMSGYDDVPDDPHMGSLNLHDRSTSRTDELHQQLRLTTAAGTKRRASSPPRDGPREDRSSVSSASGHSDNYQRRSVHHLPNKGSPMSRFHPNHSSVSSASSYAARHGSLGSSLGVPSIASSATSYASGRPSPNALSPSLDPELNAGTLYAPVSKMPTPQQRSVPDNMQPLRQESTDSTAHSRNSSLSGLHGVYMCECCPKKPKKFDTEEELRLHESEKQYTCAYCPNRFKNKNEAERHQNSLHLRRHSWSCAALPGIEAAFHTSLSSNGTDVCGYCGEEFSNPPQWDVRAEHLNVVHKIGECNQSKKFFRADHFRQHLKHSHAGTSGKWTNMLENACMKDEPPPEKRSTTGALPPPKLMVTTSSSTAGAPRTYRTIEETPDDS